jgi:hypothetical protein
MIDTAGWRRAGLGFVVKQLRRFETARLADGGKKKFAE